jgi:tRNA(Arg) A34 adenosine deaminase TadA
MMMKMVVSDQRETVGKREKRRFEALNLVSHAEAIASDGHKVGESVLK